jgi:ABC-2 type transport system ATP-binding protein
VLDVRGAEKRFGQRAVLNGVDLSLRQGELLALLGPNGAGKTTLIRAISGRVALDGGTVRVAGHDPLGDRRARSALGLVPQEIALYPDLTVRENLEILGRLAGVSRGELTEAVRRAVEWTGLHDRAGDRAGALSGGMQRRLNIAAGTLHRPRLLLLDEPTVGVDPTAREAIHQVLEALRSEGMGLLLTTHDMEQAEELADRISILVEGRICAEGSFEDLVRRHLGDARELTLTLAGVAAGQSRSLLEAEGLHPTADDRTWTGRLTGSLDSLASLSRRLGDAGVTVAEVRVREPGLRGVFFRVTGREFEA